MKVAEPVSIGASRPGTARSVTLEQARREFGPFADAFALSQRLTAARARNELNWTPQHHDALSEFASAAT